MTDLKARADELARDVSPVYIEPKTADTAYADIAAAIRAGMQEALIAAAESEIAGHAASIKDLQEQIRQLKSLEEGKP